MFLASFEVAGKSSVAEVGGFLVSIGSGCSVSARILVGRPFFRRPVFL